MVDERQLFADADRAVLLLEEAEMLRTTLQHLCETLLLGDAHLRLVNVGDGPRKIYIPVPSLGRR
jgi:hypothetical protein